MTEVALKRKLVATLALRNQGSRLYGKPLQNLDIENGISILDNIIASLKAISQIDSIVLAIADGVDNMSFINYSTLHQLQYVRGDEIDVLGRLIMAATASNATDILRVSTESPFLPNEFIAEGWQSHLASNAEATFFDGVIDGCSFEIISLDALKRSHKNGLEKHRSELCTLYIRENKDDFSINYCAVPEKLKREDLRLTVDYPEDLVVCRAVFNQFRDKAPNIPLHEIVDFLDNHPDLITTTLKFTVAGYKSMYL